MVNTSVPTYNYTFAENEEEAIRKVRLKYGEYDENIVARELTEKEINNLVIGSDYYG